MKSAFILFRFWLRFTGHWFPNDAAGDCFVVINSLTNIAYLVGEFGDIFVAFGENSRFIDNIRSFLEYENQTPDKANGEAVGVFKELELEHVSFSYEGQETAALKDISLRIRAGGKDRDRRAERLRKNNTNKAFAAVL